MTVELVIYPKSWFAKKFRMAEDGCWNWIASCDERGRGQVNVGGKPKRAHIVSWLLYRGSIPEGLHVLHKCDNPRCVNPDHLFLGTQDDNMKDAARKGHHVKAVSNERAAKIIEAFDSGISSPTTLARMFNVSRSSVRWAIARRRHEQEFL